MKCAVVQPTWIALDEINSTNMFLKSRIMQGGATPVVVSAKRQTTGRGRRERAWMSPQGGLYMSIGIPLPAQGVSPVNYGPAASVAIAELLRDDYNVDARLKWPNDILVDGKKLCGILTELVTPPDQPGHLIVGIGLNANNSVVLPDALYTATSLHQLTGRAVSVETLGHEIAEAVFRRWNSLTPETIDGLRRQWIALSSTIHQQVEIHTHGGTVTGQAVDISDIFQLIVATPDGTRAFSEGDCRITSV